ncbi:MAG TPA: peptidylprolyl isomerase, partial [Bacteroidales bacterium]|nr:peptidylprolyl isomerase [Bacteroidales bacterium]
MKIRTLVFLFLLLNVAPLKSQEVIDQVVAVVGNSPILKSDIESQYIQMMSQNYYSSSVDLKCEIFEELLFQKLLLNQAIIDSVEVTMKEVDTELNRRLSVFINQLGSEKKLEEFYKKTIAEIKDEFRTIIKEQLLTQKMQQKITADIKVSPSAVREFYNSIPADSLPLVPASYEFSQIVIYPDISQEQKDYSYQKLNDIRERILKGDKFNTMAVLYSQDPGSAAKGGELGFVSRTDLVPEFAEVAFSLTSPDEVSRIVETEFGYHILKLIERKGELVNVRHILIIPEISDEDMKKAEEELNEVSQLLKADSLSFDKAAAQYSDDV